MSTPEIFESWNSVEQQQVDGTVPSEEEEEWELYYSQKGYPYKYNRVTGESRWVSDNATQPEIGKEETTAISADQTVLDGVEVQPLSSSDSDDDNEVVFDKDMEQKFTEYLHSPAGLALLEARQ